ncbi:ankyrin repeat protein [Apiospora hydei]|uniref:Ankyrin repeat protein n=1 Tax=Apiospora hydei TaxID=1337664 RepID=A0ABR1VTB9_9PEZI
MERIKVKLQYALAVEYDEVALNLENCLRIEYLVSYFELKKSRWFLDIKLVIITICTIYLLFSNFAISYCETDEKFEKRLAKHRLYNYAARNWGLHARDNDVDDKVLSFLSKPEQVSAASQALLAGVIGYKTGLHLAAYFGLVWAVDKIGDNRSVNVKDSTGQTSLHLASAEGHKEVAKLLIEKGADVKAAANDGWTPLHWASSRGYEEVATLLIEKGADVRATDNSGLMPLHASLRHGHIDRGQFETLPPFLCSTGGLEAFNLLRNRKLHINKRDYYGSTLLSVVVRYGHEELVNQLLAIPNINCTSKDSFSRSAL